jgi:FkbM family methyltransferase
VVKKQKSNTTKQAMKGIINKLLPASFKESIRRKAGVPDIFFSIERLKKIGFNPKQIIDVGAYEGEWTRKCAKIFPEARFLMVEAMNQKKEDLQKLAAGNKRISAAISLLGAKTGEEVYFAELETASSVLEENSSAHQRSKRTINSLNDLVKEYQISKVDFIKLDVQGYELEVLKGFDQYLPGTDIVLMEASLLDIHKNVPLIKEVLDFMYQYHFVVYDICSVNTRRPLDNALWQTDLLFVKEDSVFRTDKRYEA